MNKILICRTKIVLSNNTIIKFIISLAINYKAIVLSPSSSTYQIPTAIISLMQTLLVNNPDECICLRAAFYSIKSRDILAV
jgi:hypothetical protein